MNVFFLPPDSIWQECWNIGLVLTIAMAVLNAPVVVSSGLQEATPIMAASAVAVIVLTSVYGVRHKGSY